MVDLGLPSGLLWADRNIGASSPEDFGTNFAWGETSGYNTLIKYCTAAELCVYMQPLIGDEMTLTPDNIDSILTETGIQGKDLTVMGTGFGTDKCFRSDWSDYFDTTNGGSTFNKYTTDKLKVLQPENDAATVNMGLEYRMPTQADFNELVNNCTVTFIDLQGNEFSKSEAQSGSISTYNLKGIKITGSNGNSIFIPASGGCSDDVLYYAYYYGGLWSSSLDSDNSMIAYYLNFYYNGHLNVDYYNRYYGRAARGVK